jgi:molybdopterin-biosynthesis enzyme MoeA-like protein
MSGEPSFYAVIIGSEILNARREDSHFEFIRDELRKRGWSLKASFIVKDDPKLLEDIYKLIKSDENSVMFSFGGIGSTPDDFTREVASLAFTSKPPVRDKKAQEIILERLGERAYPHPIKMADIPQGSRLIENPINKMPGFQLEDRFFFVPGFPEMAHPMITDVMDRFYQKNREKFSCNFLVSIGEATLIDIMNKLPKSIELSCLPMFKGDRKSTEIYLLSSDKDELDKWCGYFKEEIEKLGIDYKELDSSL